MKKRLILVATGVLYAALVGVTWIIGTRQAKGKTEAMLNYAANDIRVTIDGAIDTMLERLAAACIRRLGKAGAHTPEELNAVAALFDLDELNVADRTGRIISTNDPDCLDVDMTLKEETRPFVALADGVTKVVSQPFRRHAYAHSRRKYLGVPFPGGDGYVQVGMDESRMKEMIASQFAFLFDSEVGDTLCYLCADLETGKLVSAYAKQGETQTLDDIGFDASALPAAECSLMEGETAQAGETFEQTLSGEKTFCRSYVFGGYRFLVIEPKAEFYGTRDAIVEVMTVLLAVVLGAFALLLIRISGDSNRIKAFYRKEELARAREMEIAKTIQSSALPADLPESRYAALAASMTPARDVGGDFYDFFMLDAGHGVFLVADVSGKGISAALYMMTAKTLIKDILLSEHDLSAALMRVNDDLSRNNPANMFLTAWVGVIDFGTGRVEFVNAGHNPPIVRRADGTAVWMSEKSGPLLAFVEGAKYRSSSFDLAPGDTLFLYTDGVTEAMDAKGDLFGETRLMEAFSVAPSGEPPTLCRLVRTLVTAFAAGTPPTDDLTVLAVKYLSRPRRFVRTFTTTQAGIAAASKFLDKIDAKENNAGLNSTIPTLHVILDEVASNIVRHSDASGFAVEMEVSHDGVTIDFIDDGAPYNPLLHVDPDTSLGADKRPVGGLGILMVKKMATSVAYRRDHSRNILRVSKNWNG